MWQKARISSIKPHDPPGLLGAEVWIESKPPEAKRQFKFSFHGAYMTEQPEYVTSITPISPGCDRVTISAEAIELLGGPDAFTETPPPETWAEFLVRIGAQQPDESEAA